MDSGFLVTAGGTALISSIIIQWIKKSQLDIFNLFGTEKNKQFANQCLSIVVAFITSIGIGYKYDATAGTLLLTGLTIASLEHGLWHWMLQWISQHVAYKTLIVPQELQASNIDVLNQLLDQLKGNPEPVVVQPIIEQKVANEKALPHFFSNSK